MKLLFWSSVFCLLLLACAPTVFLQPIPELPAEMQRLARELEQAGFSLTDVSAEADYLLLPEVSHWAAPCVPGPVAFLLARETWVPLINLSSYREDLALEEILTGHAPVLFRLEADWLLPPGYLACTVEGKNLTEPAYPLRREVFLTLTAVDKRNRHYLRLLDLLSALYPPPGKQAAREKITWLGAVGDMMLQRGVQDAFFDPGRGLEYIFNDTLPLLRQLDILCGNLEGAVTLGGTRQPKAYNFRFDPRVVTYLAQAGFDYLSLTNNHSFDYGLEGFKHTLAYLEEAEMPTSGVGLNLDQAREPALLESGDARVAIFSFGAYPAEGNGFDGLKLTAATPTRPGVLWASEENSAALEARLNPAHFNVAFVHGGYEWQSIPAAQYVALYRRLIEGGFRVVFAAHPHVLQGIELYQRGVIFYSLGNFIFPGMEEMPFAQDSLIAAVGIFRRQPFYLRLTPVELRSHRIFLESGSEGKILKRLLSLPVD